MRRPIIAGNWKMNKTPSETAEFLARLKERNLSEDVDAVVCVPATNLCVANRDLKDSDILLGAQNMHYEKSGAFTGETSVEALLDLNVSYVVLGHSERREYFHEEDSFINKKVKTALENHITPILCVGETLEEREAGEEEHKVFGQLREDLAGLAADDFFHIVIAYEPIWAIGTGKTASADDAEAMCAFIRETVRELFDENAANSVRIQYGGSVKPENVSEIMSKENIDGALVGGASLEVDSFTSLVNYQK